jgi:hypothetical protein
MRANLEPQFWLVSWLVNELNEEYFRMSRCLTVGFSLDRGGCEGGWIRGGVRKGPHMKWTDHGFGSIFWHRSYTLT